MSSRSLDHTWSLPGDILARFEHGVQFDAKSLALVDETVALRRCGLYRDAFISDAIWTALSERYNTQQLLDVVFTIAESEMLASLTNSCALISLLERPSAISISTSTSRSRGVSVASADGAACARGPARRRAPMTLPMTDGSSQPSPAAQWRIAVIRSAGADA